MVTGLNRVHRSLGKTILKMRKHELHKILDRADEVAMLLQHKIAKNADLLLQLAECRDPSSHRYDHADSAEAGQTEVMESTLPELHLEM